MVNNATILMEAEMNSNEMIIKHLIEYYPDDKDKQKLIKRLKKFNSRCRECIDFIRENSGCWA